jgi:RimJ/RimL family protein N-acetyltransferase
VTPEAKLADLPIDVLEHEILRLEPLTRGHTAGLRQAAFSGADLPEFASMPTEETAADYVNRSLARAAAGNYLPFAQIAAQDRVVGHTAYLTPRFWPATDRLLAIEIGSSWLHPSVQGTAVNTVSKLLLMTHAFESWNVSRIDIKTDARNERARAGIEAIGARFEGILRNWQPSDAPGEDGAPRDTAMHSITADEWPDAKRALQARIGTKRVPEWAIQDSNLGPLPYQRSALTD